MARTIRRRDTRLGARGVSVLKGCLLAATLALFAAPHAALGACVGDCDGDGTVSISELVLGVNIALGTQPVSMCRAFDGDGNGEVQINELLAGVNDSATGCTIAATPTPTATPAPTGDAETRCTVAPGDGVNFDPSQPFCDLLSSYRFFRGNGAAQEPNANVLPYDLNTALFADYALKHRFVWMPPGTAATYNPHDSFTFPVGAVIIKTFAFPADYRDLSLGERVLETRLLVRRATGWDPITYVWNDEQTEAHRRVIGATLPITWIQLDGSERSIMYHVPNTNQCKECHEEHNSEIGPLGPKARNLNKDYAYAEGTENQLTHWAGVGYLRNAPDPSTAPRAAVFDDPSTGTVEFRARTYLDVNCGHCHNPTGLARTSGLYLDIDETDAGHFGVCKPPVAAGHGSGNLKVDIYPGRPDLSILSYRMESTMPGVAMPELGRQTAHEEALAVINEWIAGLTLPGCD